MEPPTRSDGAGWLRSCQGDTALVRRQWGLARDIASGAAAVMVVALMVGRTVNDEWPKLLGDLVRNDGPASYPAAGLALWIAISSVASSHLSRPYRYLGRWIMWLGALGSLGLGVTTPSGSLGAVALGLGMAAAVHLVFGSPSSRWEQSMASPASSLR